MFGWEAFNLFFFHCCSKGHFNLKTCSVFQFVGILLQWIIDLVTIITSLPTIPYLPYNLLFFFFFWELCYMMLDLLYLFSTIFFSHLLHLSFFLPMFWAISLTPPCRMLITFLPCPLTESWLLPLQLLGWVCWQLVSPWWCLGEKQERNFGKGIFASIMKLYIHCGEF